MVDKPTRDRELFTVLNKLKDMTPTEIAKKAAKLGKTLSPATIANWRKPLDKGGTKYPQRYTLDAAARVAGFRVGLIPLEEKPAQAETGNRVTREARGALLQ